MKPIGADSDYTERAEQFTYDLMLEDYRVGAGWKDRMDLVPIYERYAELFEEQAVRERITRMRSAPQNLQARYLADFAVTGFMQDRLKQLTESIANAELSATIEWDGQRVAYQNVHSVLVREGDTRRRHDLQQRSLAVTVKQNGDRARRFGMQHDLARELGWAGYRPLIEELRGWDLAVLGKALDPLLKETDDIFEDRLGRWLASAHVPRGQANTSDVAYVMRALEFDALFPGDRLIPVLGKTVAGMGLPFESTPGLKLDTETRPLKSPRAFCAPVKVPGEVYLVIKPVGGQDDYRALFHESGHAEHFLHIDAGLAFEYRYLGEEAVSETFAFLFEHLTSTPRWLVDLLHVPLREAERYQRFALFNKLWLLRRYTAKLRYELLLHDHGPDGMDTAYRDLLGEALHVGIPPERYLDDVDDGFYAAGYLRAWIFERQLGLFMEEQFGEAWYESRDAGGFLQSLWSVGMRDSVDVIARSRLGAKGLDPRPLIAELSDF